jgi:ArsR family transcriptional regulator
MRTLADVFKALSDETRLNMLGLLCTYGELCVCDFVEVLEITQSKASRHLRYLVNAGLVNDRREAVWVYFRIPEKPTQTAAEVLKMLPKVLESGLSPSLATRLKAWRQKKARTGSCGV